MSQADRALAHVVLSIKQMYWADIQSMQESMPGIYLMDQAAAAVARAIRRRWTPRPTVVICGPGNNGGDGFGVARRLAAARWPVTVALLGAREEMRGDAATMADRWHGPVVPLGPTVMAGQSLVVDALFGAGLSRPIEGVAADTLRAVHDRELPAVAIDMPSGVHGDSGQIMGQATRAALTVTFCRPKPGHYLLPGRGHCGVLHIADIGIDDAIVRTVAGPQWCNNPDIWRAEMPQQLAEMHKYEHGHAVVVGGGASSTGAARLAAAAALRAGAGLVTIAVPESARDVYASQMTSEMLRPVDDDLNKEDKKFTKITENKKISSFLIGPGTGVKRATKSRVLAAAETGKSLVLDADALTIFQDDPQVLWQARARCPGASWVLTPHAGEFARIFPEITNDSISKLDLCRKAAEISSCIVVLKGSDTIVAAPDGRSVINTNAPPNLATAGSGDVLAGIVLAMVTRQVPAFEAACMSVWIHGEAGRLSGVGVTSEGLLNAIGAAFASACKG